MGTPVVRGCADGGRFEDVGRGARLRWRPRPRGIRACGRTGRSARRCRPVRGRSTQGGEAGASGARCRQHGAGADRRPRASAGGRDQRRATARGMRTDPAHVAVAIRSSAAGSPGPRRLQISPQDAVAGAGSGRLMPRVSGASPSPAAGAAVASAPHRPVASTGSCPARGAIPTDARAVRAASGTARLHRASRNGGLSAAPAGWTIIGLPDNRRAGLIAGGCAPGRRTVPDLPARFSAIAVSMRRTRKALRVRSRRNSVPGASGRTSRSSWVPPRPRMPFGRAGFIATGTAPMPIDRRRPRPPDERCGCRLAQVPGRLPRSGTPGSCRPWRPDDQATGAWLY